jgi:hypothetical protein
MRQKNSAILAVKFLAFPIIAAVFCSCAPRVDDVSYAEYHAYFKNTLSITVNTRSGLFKGRESFLHFKRDTYEFSFETRGKTYTEKDMSIFIWPKRIDVKPRLGTVRISEEGPDGIVVTVDIDDQNIPKLINGKYRLRLSSDSSNIRKDKDKEAREFWYKLR